MILLSALRDWWRWRMRRGKVHIPGIAEYRNVGVVTNRDDDYWRIVDDEGRTFFARAEWSRVPDVNAGDRVQFEPVSASTGGTRLSNRGWVIVGRVTKRS
jgi:hypothetical protein